MNTLQIGLDPSINNTGFAVFINNKKLIDHGVIKTKSSGASTDDERLIVLNNYVTNIIHKYALEYDVRFENILVVIEDFQLRKEDATKDRNFDNLKKLCYAIGACIGGCVYGGEVVMVKPLKWKGTVSKEQTQKQVGMLYGIGKVNHNSADAIMMVHTVISTRRIMQRIKK